MSSNTEQLNETGNRKRIATIAMILVACCVTLVGVISGLEPDVILIRCIIAAIIAGVSVRMATIVLSAILK